MEHHKHESTPSFFEKYQTFISIIIAGLLIGGGIVLSKTIPPAQGTQNGNQPQAQTEKDVRAELIKTAKSLSLDSKALGACLDNKSQEATVNAASALATQSGVSGTPTFFILKRTIAADGTITVEKQIPVVGARDKQTFMDAIEKGIQPAGQQDLTGAKIVLNENDHYLGPKNASIVIVEYSDIDCPFCKRAKPTIDQILKEHPEYALVYRHAPLVQLHPFAAYKAQATECIATTNGPEGFWKFLDVISK
ncbi:MAG: thioredoxin domain-containing protein [bacterium]